MTASNALRRIDIAPHVPGPRRIAMLLEANGYTSLAAWARDRQRRTGDSRFRPGTVNQAINGHRRNASTELILDAIAEDTGKTRRVIDALVAGKEPTEDAADVREVAPRVRAG